MTISTTRPAAHPADSPAVERIDSRNALAGRLVLVLVLCAAAATRLAGLDRFPFEQDELYTVIESRTLFASPLNPGIEARPLYYLLQHPLLALGPVSHVTLRLLPFAFGMLGIWATWALAKRLFGTVGAGVAALLAAVSPWHLHASGMARYWTLIYLLSALFALFLHRAYTDDRPRDYLVALGVLLLGACTHPSFVFPVVGVAAGVTAVRRDGRLGWRWPSRNAWSCLWLPFMVACVAAFLALTLTDRQSAVKNWDGRGWLASLRLLPAMVEWMTPTVFAAGGLGALVLLRSHDAGRRMWAAMALLGVLAATLLLALASTTTSVYADYGMAMLPLILVSAGGLVALGAERARSDKAAFALVASLLLLAGILPGTVSHLSDGTRFDYRPAFRAITETAPSVTVLSYPIILQRHYAPHLRGAELEFRSAFLDASLAREGDLWIVIPIRREGTAFDSFGEVAPWLARHCRLHSSSQRPRFDYRIYRTDLHRCARTP